MEYFTPVEVTPLDMTFITTTRHRINPAIITKGLQPHAVRMFTRSGLPQETQMSYLHTACRLGHSCLLALMVILIVSSSTSNAWGSETPHAADGHNENHGAHHSEIGANPPPGTSLEDFESPAELRRDLAIWSFAVFFMLMLLLSAVAWKPIMKGLDAREQGIADMIAATQNAHDDAKNQLASYERRLAEAAEEVKGMLDEARRDAETTKQTIVTEARQAADEEKQRAKKEIEMARDDAISQLAEKAGDLAVGVAEKFIREKISPEDKNRLVRESVASLSTSPSAN